MILWVYGICVWPPSFDFSFLWAAYLTSGGERLEQKMQEIQAWRLFFIFRIVHYLPVSKISLIPGPLQGLLFQVR